MANEVEKFDPSTLMQGVKDRIKATFVSLIPDDKWEEMVNSEIQKFFAPHDNSGYNYRRNSEVSDFTYVVHEVLREEAKKKITEVLGNADFQVMYAGDNQSINEVLKQRIIANAGQIFASAIEGSIANAISMMRNR